MGGKVRKHVKHIIINMLVIQPAYQHCLYKYIYTMENITITCTDARNQQTRGHIEYLCECFHHVISNVGMLCVYLCDNNMQ